jgi:hypothetical protein
MVSAIISRSWFGRAWDVATDLLLATAVLWTLPLLLGAVAAVLRLLLQWVS